MEPARITFDDAAALPWPEGGGRTRFGQTTGADSARALVRSLAAPSFAAVADAWRAADHRRIIEVWRQDCGKWNLWTNGHEVLYGLFVHEPTARLLGGLDVAHRRAQALGIDPKINRTDASTFVAAWTTVSGHSVAEPSDFGSLLTDPPAPWAVGLVLASILIADGDLMPAAISPLAEALEREAR
jgi:hypothetical protein